MAKLAKKAILSKMLMTRNGLLSRKVKRKSQSLFPVKTISMPLKIDKRTVNL